MNKKNIRLTNVKYMEPISQTKSNFVETQRLMLTSGNRPSTSSKHVHSNSNISNYLQKGNQIINEIFRNHSPQRGKSLYSLNKQTKIKKTNINNTSSYQITKTTPNSPNILVSKNKSYKNTSTNNNNNNNNNYHSHYIKAKKASIISNPNSALRSSTSSFSQGSKGNIHSNNLNQNKIKNKYTHTTKSRCGNSGLNSASHMSRDFLSAQLSPSSSSTSLSNLRQLYKETSSNNNNNNNNSTVSKKQQRTPISCNKLRNVDQSGYINTTGVLTTNNNNNINQLSTKENSISVNNKVKTTIKTSLYTDYCSNTIKDINDIETPEELHFFYVSVIQNGKLVEFKFESEQSNQNNKS